MSELQAYLVIGLLVAVIFSIWGVSRRLEVVAIWLEKLFKQVEEDAAERGSESREITQYLERIWTQGLPSPLDDDEDEDPT